MMCTKVVFHERFEPDHQAMQDALRIVKAANVVVGPPKVIGGEENEKD